MKRRSRNVVTLRGSSLVRLKEDVMKTMWDEDPTELLGLEEEGGPFDLAGSEDDEEEEPTESMSFGEDEGEEGEESYDLSGFDEEEDPTEYGADEDEYEEDDSEEAPEMGQRIRGAGIALGFRGRSRRSGAATTRNRKRGQSRWPQQLRHLYSSCRPTYGRRGR
jgi:hypothetical protein